MNQPRLPIFIHAMWRTGSTYIWKAFRDQQAYRAYYEPFHELLRTWRVPDAVTAAKLQKRLSQAFHHPPVDALYFAEYPTSPNSGVPLFGKRFSYQNVWLDPGDQDEHVKEYLANLIQFANQKRQVPVFKFTRSLFRSGWLSNTFRSHNLLILRSPQDTWHSFCSQGTYYAAVVCQLVGQNPQHPVLGQLATDYGVPYFERPTVEEERALYRAWAARPSSDVSGIFYECYVLGIICTLPYVDCVIDVNALSESEATRDHVRERLANCEINLDLTGLHIPTYGDSLPLPRYPLIERVVARMPRQLEKIHSCVAAHLPELGGEFRHLLARALGATPAELEVPAPSIASL